ncbi:hypothetical protein CMU45_02750 [Elizabethkingia anophelis]|nr:hypothetical protein [Elizabethkingia anophelis]
MENTLKNKAAFFAQYWGQKVLMHSEKQIFPHGNNWGSSINCKDFLELKSIEDIMDEDAWEVGIRINCWSRSERKQSWFKDDEMRETHIMQGRLFSGSIGKYLGPGMSHPFAENSTDILDAYDQLRAMGYALPYMGLSIEKLVEYGWVKLKNRES